MKKSREQGFSLIELLLVVVVVGIVAALAIPAYQRGMWAAENGSAFSTMRTINSTQLTFYTQNSRYARLDEINAILGNGAGTLVGDKLVKGRYVFEMTPERPEDSELVSEYYVTATRDVTGDAIYQYEMDQTGLITQIYPEGAPTN